MSEIVLEYDAADFKTTKKKGKIVMLGGNKEGPKYKSQNKKKTKNDG